MSVKSILAAAFAGAFLMVGSAQAQDKTKIRFTLDWKYQGIHAFARWRS